MNLADADLAVSNSLYCSIEDARWPYVSVGNFIYRFVPHAEIPKGHVALNPFQKMHARAATGIPVEIWPFQFPTDRDFTLKMMTVEARWLAQGLSAPDLTHFANTLRSQLVGSVMTFGQSIRVRFGDDDVLIWVKSDVRGVVTSQTQIGVEWI